MFQRSELEILKSRILEPRRFLQVVLGPRQVGKTTLVTQLINELEMPSHYASADGIVASDNNWLSGLWETARLRMKQQGQQEFLLVVDEVQKISNWSEVVKHHWDRDTVNQVNIKVILLGSSRLLMQQGLTESLAGRFETLPMTHWDFSEMQSAFGFSPEQYAWFGGYPGSAALIEDEKRWKSYIKDSLIETSLTKDLLMLTRIDKPGLLRNLFELGCLYSGQVLSMTKMLGQLVDAGNTTTLSHYLHLLHTAGLLSGIEKYSGSIVRQRAGSPKFQVHNNALLSALRTDSFREVSANHSEWGRVVESAVGSYLLNESLKHGLKLHYWREGLYEVDFILVYQSKTIAIEVKSMQARGKHGINAFLKHHTPHKIYLLGTDCLTWQEFLKTPVLDLF